MSRRKPAQLTPRSVKLLRKRGYIVGSARREEGMSDHPEYDRTDTQCQPCGNFEPKTGFYGIEMHSCPWCDSTRVPCTNCHHDHHRGGAQQCPNSRAGCVHPACIKAEVSA